MTIVMLHSVLQLQNEKKTITKTNSAGVLKIYLRVLTHVLYGFIFWTYLIPTYSNVVLSVIS